MGFWDFLKKRNIVAKQPPQSTKLEANFLGECFDKLTPEGDLPCGWLSRNKAFIDRIEAEYSHFLHMWIDARKKSSKELYPALKSFVLYLQDAERLCKSKGECFEFWFYEVIASKDYISKRKSELGELTANFDVLQKEYEIKAWEQAEQERKTMEMKDDVIILLKTNDGILQSDFWKLFDDENSREAAKNIVYSLFHEGKIERTQSGRSFLLHYKD